ncbi:MAG: thermonuclease family protein [Candidatus Omnitrophica bacterium]|nr:thermonuclease family protein [Candidatus Omnitrophota bacterium]
MHRKFMFLCIIALVLSCPASAFCSEGVLVKRVVDGDTVVLSDGERVRLIGIDTPEMHESNKLYRDARRTRRDVEAIKRSGKESYLFTKGLLEGKRVRLEFDVERRDRYGRLLAYVFLEDGTMANARIIEEGFAQVYTFPPNVKYTDELLRLERQARQRGRGLWKEGP